MALNESHINIYTESLLNSEHSSVNLSDQGEEQRDVLEENLDNILDSISESQIRIEKDFEEIEALDKEIDNALASLVN